MNSIDISPEALTRIKALAQKATPGPWLNPGRQFIVSVVSKEEPIICDVKSENTRNDIAYIAAAHPGVILAMCEEIERLRDMRLDQVGDAAVSILNAAMTAFSDGEIKSAVHLGTVCPYCDYESSSIEEAKAHDGTCPKHPAVIRAARLEKEADWLARVCAEQMLEGVDEQSVQWWRKKARGAAEANND